MYEWGFIRISTIPLVTAHPPALLPSSSYKGHFSLVYLPCGEHLVECRTGRKDGL